MLNTVKQLLLDQALRLAPLSAALILLAFDAPPWVAEALLAGSCVVLWAGFGLKKPSDQRVARGFLLAAALTVAAVNGSYSWQLAAASLILLTSMLQEPLYEQLFNGQRITAANLPGVPRTDASTELQSILAAHWLALLLVIGSAADGVPGWIPLAATCVIPVMVGATSALAWKNRFKDGGADRRARIAAVHATRPRFAVYFSAPAGTEYQMAMWLPHFERIGDPFVIVTREVGNVAKLAGMTEAPVVHAKSIADVEDLLAGSVRSVFYVNNAMRNAHAVRLHELTHIQLGHGESDKVASINPVFRMYDLIFVAGQAAIDRFRKNGVAIPDSQFRIVGRPQIADIAVGPRRPGPDGRRTVLYAPTWKGHSGDSDYCSLGLGVKMLKALTARDVNVILRPHPYTRQNHTSRTQLEAAEAFLAQDAAASGRAHRWGKAASTELSLVECFNSADALVTDVSSVAADWLYSERPIAITDVHGLGDAFAEEFPLGRAAYIVDAKARNIEEVVDGLVGADSMESVRLETKRYYLGDFPAESYTEVFTEAVEQTYAGGVVADIPAQYEADDRLNSSVGLPVRRERGSRTSWSAGARSYEAVVSLPSRETRSSSPRSARFGPAS